MYGAKHGQSIMEKVDSDRAEAIDLALHRTEDDLMIQTEEMYMEQAKRRHGSQHPSHIARDQQHLDITVSVELKPVISQLY